MKSSSRFFVGILHDYRRTEENATTGFEFDLEGRPLCRP